MKTITELTYELNRTSDEVQRRMLKNLICAKALNVERELIAIKSAVKDLLK